MSHSYMNGLKPAKTVFEASSHKFLVLQLHSHGKCVFLKYRIFFLQALVHHSKIIMPRVTPTGQSTFWLMLKDTGERMRHSCNHRSRTVFQHCIWLHYCDLVFLLGHLASTVNLLKILARFTFMKPSFKKHIRILKFLANK